MNLIKGIVIEQALQSDFAPEVCEALVGCMFVPREGDKAFEVLKVLESEPHELVNKASGVERTTRVGRGHIEASDALLAIILLADRPHPRDAELLDSKGLGRSWNRADAAKLAYAFRSPSVPGVSERRCVLDLIARVSE